MVFGPRVGLFPVPVISPIIPDVMHNLFPDWVFQTTKLESCAVFAGLPIIAEGIINNNVKYSSPLFFIAIGLIMFGLIKKALIKQAACDIINSNIKRIKNGERPVVIHHRPWGEFKLGYIKGPNFLTVSCNHLILANEFPTLAIPLSELCITKG